MLIELHTDGVPSWYNIFAIQRVTVSDGDAYVWLGNGEYVGHKVDESPEVISRMMRDAQLSKA